MLYIHYMPKHIKYIFMCFILLNTFVIVTIRNHFKKYNRLTKANARTGKTDDLINRINKY